MNKAVWKFPLEVTDLQVIEMPAGSEVLSVATQYGDPVMWAKVNLAGEKVGRRVWIAGTGNPLPLNIDDMIFVGTFLLAEGAFVGHVWVEP